MKKIKVSELTENELTKIVTKNLKNNPKGIRAYIEQSFKDYSKDKDIDALLKSIKPAVMAKNI